MFVLKKKYKKDIATYAQEVRDIELSRKRFICLLALVKWQIGRKWMGVRYENLFFLSHNQIICDFNLIRNVGSPEQLFEKIKPILITHKIDYIIINDNKYWTRKETYYTMPMEKEETNIYFGTLKWFKEIFSTSYFKIGTLILSTTLLLFYFIPNPVIILISLGSWMVVFLFTMWFNIINGD